MAYGVADVIGTALEAGATDYAVSDAAALAAAGEFSSTAAAGAALGGEAAAGLGADALYGTGLTAAGGSATADALYGTAGYGAGADAIAPEVAASSAIPEIGSTAPSISSGGLSSIAPDLSSTAAPTLSSTGVDPTITTGSAGGGGGAPSGFGGDPSVSTPTPDVSTPDVSIPDSPVGPSAPDQTTNEWQNLVSNEASLTSNNPSIAANPSVSGNSSVMNALHQLGAVGKSASQFAPLASLGLNYAASKKVGSAQQQLNDIAKPTSAVSNKLLSQYQTGTLNPADAQAIAQYQQEATAKVKQYYASAGLSNSSMEADAISKIGQQAEAMRGQAVQNLLTGGLNAAGIAQGPQIAAVQASVAADQQLSNATSNFMAALAKMNTQQSGSGSGTP